MRAARACQFLAASCCLALWAPACGNTESSEVRDGSGSADSPDGPDLNLGGEGTGSDKGSGNGVANPTETCAGELLEAKYIPLDMYVMLDASGSMLDPTEGDPAVSKWQAVTAALTEFVDDPASEGLGVGLQTFPLSHPDAPEQCTSNQQCGDTFGPCFLKACWPPDDEFGLIPCQSSLDCSSFRCVTFGICENDDNYVCPEVGQGCGPDENGVELGDCVDKGPSVCMVTADCRASAYAAPAAPIGVLPDSKPELLAAIEAAEPNGLTPSGPALSGAIAQASAWAEAHPDHQVVAVFATDGLPTLEASGEVCGAVSTQAQRDAVAAIAAGGLAATPSISTFVIGVLGPNDAGAPATLHAIAERGGTGEAFLVDTAGDVALQFRDALNDIRSSRLACEMLVPEAEAGKALDFNQVNVSFDDGSGPSDLFNVDGAADCDPSVLGWYYDPPLGQGTPERIVACPSTCAAFGMVDTGSVQIKLGCETRKPVK